jgi:methylated-DNA-[protein]-cysteine S-methyltransferase
MQALEVLSYEADGFGVGELVLRGGRPVHHELPQPAARPAPRHVELEACDPEAAAPAERLLGQIGRYFGGAVVRWTAAQLRLAETLEEWGATSFQRALAHALCAVPYGETVSYGELAERAGAPRAARAAGSFCAENRLGLFLPCHRVVLADGSAGSYGGLGPRYKLRLQALEQAALRVPS